MRPQWIFLLALFFIIGCQAETPANRQEKQPKTDNTGLIDNLSGLPPDKPASDDFRETSRVINSLYNDKLKIGDERYLELKAKLELYESEGKEVSDLRTKLEALKISESKPAHDANSVKSGSLSALENEINTIYEKKSFVRPEHYNRMKADLDYFESNGADKALIESLRKKMAGISLPGPATITASSNDTFRKDPELPSALERTQLPDCEGKMFAVFPVDMQNVYEISPLGAIGPPGHTFPTEHSFIHLHATGTSAKQYPLYAPAEVTITHVRKQSGITQDEADYTIYFALCKDVIGYYNHVKKISAEVDEILKGSECLDFGQQTVCAKNVFSKVKSGTVLGEVGGVQGNFDFGLVDLSRKQKFANPERYGGRTLHIQCPYDYYAEAGRQKFFALIKRNDEQKCGTIAQDIPGTLAGNWFKGDARADLSSDWERHLAFVSEPGKSTVSIGGTISSPKTISFTPENSGTVNRDFSNVMPDGKIYCYTDGASKVLVKLETKTELKIEHGSGGCSNYGQFAAPHVYNR